MASLFNLSIGLVVTFLLGLGIRPLLKRVKRADQLPPPSEAFAEKWKLVTKGDDAGALLGHLERLVFFGSFWTNATFVVGAWLAFKVASKWNVWSNVISVPKSIPDADELDYLIARRRWGSQLLMAFLIGTLFNLAVGYAGAAVGLHALDIIQAACGLANDTP